MSTDFSPYAGRWVALAQGQVAGVGETPEAAWRLAQRNRHKERLTLHYVAAPGGEPLALPPLLADIRPALDGLAQPVYLVGGAVRDAVLGRTSHDLDFVTPEAAIRLAFKVADFLRQPAYALDQERDTGRVVLAEAETTLDFARFRGADLTADLQDRDFTINAMAVPATAVSIADLIDPCNGLADLSARKIRLTRPDSLERDPVRALRALRLALQLDFTLTDETTTAVIAAAPSLTQTSTERVRDELLKLFEGPAPDRALQGMLELSLLPSTLPEIAALAGVAQSPPHIHPVFEHTVAVLRWLAEVETAVLHPTAPLEPALELVQQTLSPYAEPLAAYFGRVVDGGVNGRLLLRLGAVCHDVGKPATQTVAEDGRIRFLGHEQAGAEITARRLRRLILSNQAIKHVEVIVAHHMRPLHLATAVGGPSRRAIYRYFQAAQSAGLDVGLLALADHLGTYGGPGPAEGWERLVGVVGRLFEQYFDHHSEAVAPTPLLTGSDLIHELSIAPGPEIGRLLRLLQEAQAVGEISSREEALALARRNHAG
jgi:poly(A) polymerase